MYRCSEIHVGERKKTIESRYLLLKIVKMPTLFFINLAVLDTARRVWKAQSKVLFSSRTL